MAGAAPSRAQLLDGRLEARSVAHRRGGYGSGAGYDRAVPYDEDLAARLHEQLADRSDVSERKMFGGLAMMVAGNMAVGIIGDELMVRVGPESYEDALDQPHARIMDFTGRPMKGFVSVAREGIAADADLRSWVDRGVAYAASLPPK